MSVTPEATEAKAHLLRYRETIETALVSFSAEWPDSDLYEPISYLLAIGGKRLRPSLVLAAAEAEGGDTANALPAALAVEIFHNFTLMHDDIMDNAPLRRGVQTVHERWDTNTAILSGDAMFVEAYQALAAVNKAHLADMLRLFNRTAIEVCEGQQRDMAFEQRDDVQLDEYIEMIRLKTSVLLAAALELGAMAAGSASERCAKYYEFGLCIGLAFQLQDDYLDAFGDPATFGKQVGGDILSDKKTYLHIRCRERATTAQLAAFDALTGATEHPTGKVEAVKQLYLETGAAEELRATISDYHQKALVLLDELNPEPTGRAVLMSIAALVAERVS